MPSSKRTAASWSRPAQGLLLVLVLFCSSGATCTRGLRNPFARSLGPPAPEVLLPGASLEQVIAAVNQNSARVVSYQTNDASITVPGMPNIPLLRGNIAAQRPCRVRLQAGTALGGPEVDLGSNEELFWFWVRRNEPPALYFSRHDQFVGSAAQQVLPIEPQWLFDALGLMQFSPSDQHQGPWPHGNGTLEVQSIVNSRSGQLTKRTVIDTRACVLEQHIYDSSGVLLASAVARSHRYFPELGAALPQEVSIRVPSAQLSMSIDVGTLMLNQVADNPSLWTLPVMSGYPQVDLGTAPPGAVPPISTAASKDWSTFASPAMVGLTPEMVAGDPRYSPPTIAPPAPSQGVAERPSTWTAPAGSQVR
jgi:hypothetical protein